MRKYLTLLIFLFGCGGNSANTAISNTNSNSKTCAGSSPLRIMPLGDSITEAESPQNSYRRPLWVNLKNAGCEIDFVGRKQGTRNSAPPNPDFDLDHEGYWGYRIDQILPFIQVNTREANPDVVLIHLGSNDIFKGQSFDSSIDELKVLINEIRAVRPDVTIFLAKLIPSTRFIDQIRTFNSKIESELGSFSSATSKIIIVDQNTDYLLSDNYDGTHPNQIGEQKIGDKWANAIVSEFTS